MQAFDTLNKKAIRQRTDGTIHLDELTQSDFSPAMKQKGVDMQ